eukprot:6707435-Pyramimonas_sp.AAC.3
MVDERTMAYEPQGAADLVSDGHRLGLHASRLGFARAAIYRLILRTQVSGRFMDGRRRENELLVAANLLLLEQAESQSVLESIDDTVILSVGSTEFN